MNLFLNLLFFLAQHASTLSTLNCSFYCLLLSNRQCLSPSIHSLNDIVYPDTPQTASVFSCTAATQSYRTFRNPLKYCLRVCECSVSPAARIDQRKKNENV